MKILHFACLAGLLWLTGCATNGTPGTSGNGPFNNESSSGATNHTPVIPNGKGIDQSRIQCIGTPS